MVDDLTADHLESDSPPVVQNDQHGVPTAFTDDGQLDLTGYIPCRRYYGCTYIFTNLAAEN
jgi:hypothetical protein